MLGKCLVQWKHSTVQFSGSWSLVKYEVSEHREVQFERDTDSCRALHFEPLRAKFVDLVNQSIMSRSGSRERRELWIQKLWLGNRACSHSVAVARYFWRSHKDKSCAPWPLFSFTYSLCVLPVLLLKPWETLGWARLKEFGQLYFTIC